MIGSNAPILFSNNETFTLVNLRAEFESHIFFLGILMAHYYTHKLVANFLFKH